MAQFEITRVRTVQPVELHHEHIEEVELNDNPSVRISRATVVRDLRNPYGDRYYTYARGTLANVIVVGCPSCAFGDYITTEPDWTTENNLLSLPRF